MARFHMSVHWDTRVHRQNHLSPEVSKSSCGSNCGIWNESPRLCQHSAKIQAWDGFPNSDCCDRRCRLGCCVPIFGFHDQSSNRTGRRLLLARNVVPLSNWPEAPASIPPWRGTLDWFGKILGLEFCPEEVWCSNWIQIDSGRASDVVENKQWLLGEFPSSPVELKLIFDPARRHPKASWQSSANNNHPLLRDFDRTSNRKHSTFLGTDAFLGKWTKVPSQCPLKTEEKTRS